MAAIPAKEVTTQQVLSVRFAFYSDDEVRKLSVKRIISPVIFDNVKNPVPEGLYDPALGPIDFHGRCSTCGLNHTNCPGHFGHIELPNPVYNPLIFKTLYRLLRNTCLNCYHFRMNRPDVAKFVEKLQQLSTGDLVEALAVNVGKQAASKMEEELDLGGKDDTPGDKHAPKRKGAGRGGCCGPVVLTSHTLEAVKDTISEFYSRMPKGKCSNCGAHSPDIKKQGHTKLFKVWTSAKALTQNAARGITITNVMDDGKALTALEDAMAQELQEKEAAAAKRQRKGADDKKRDEKKGGADGMDTDDDDDDEEEEGKKAALKGRKKEEAGDDSSDEDEDMGIGKPIDKAAASGKKKVQTIEDADHRPKYMTPLEVEEVMRRLWQAEQGILSLIFAAEVEAPSRGNGAVAVVKSKAGAALPVAPSAVGQGHRMFFLRVLPVAPNKFRPPSKIGDEMFDHVQNTTLAKILNTCLEMQSIQVPAAEAGQQANGLGASPEQMALQRSAELGRYINLWLSLQNNVSALMDTTTAENANDAVGIRQQLEKKEGLFRKNMMGKRVNFAARSVISPDPYIGSGEIGVPPYFAKRLSFPERVTPWNVERLREAVIRGPDEHPGAVCVENERGQIIMLATLTRQKREALAKQLLSGTAGHGGGVGAGSGAAAKAALAAAGHSKGGAAAASGPFLGPGKIVYRHLQDGDLMLTNRQPTLHKPGLMAHRARVLRGERTIRMHYSNCATFNADFDGDEINLHLPQDQLGRAEGYGIVHADWQYIVPTDGKPIRGLIQDHVVSGVLLTKRDTFLTRAQYMQLVYIGCTPWVAAGPPVGSGQPPRQLTHGNDPIVLEPPTILKPRPMWTGKQVVSTVVRHFTRGLPPLTFSAGSKVPADYWGKTSGEHELVFYRGYLVAGCVDKNQFTKFGLVHAMQELYGNAVAGRMLSSFSRLFTHYLQWNGFTCGVDDLLLIPQAEAKRRAILSKAEAIAVKASAEFVGQPVPEDKNQCANAAAKRKAVAAEEAVCAALSERYRANRDTGKAHDMKGSGVMHPLSSEVVGACLPSGQVKAFPHNCLSLMTVSGAKGSLVNFSQISCLLGQQELEGRRVPRMSSGKTLPCFRAYDAGARSCGFVGDRFLTGLRPQEYYFHCMAGREGLVDTTVKTSRSGYLQRCLIKNLESLRVHYDGTVRDNCDGSVVQFFYGEDGIDVMNTSYMKQFSFLARNADRFAQQLDLGQAVSVSKVAKLRGMEKEVAAASAERAALCQKLAALDISSKKAAKVKAQLGATLPVMAVHPPAVLGSVSEAFSDALAAYVAANPDGILLTKEERERKLAEEAAAAEASAGKKKGGAVVAARSRAPKQQVDAGTFAMLTQLKYMRSLAAPGEAVGVIAAQSIGEPSTQMTLNTFHMAGRGEANVTLGIPRLREILMTAATKIKTPVMTLPLKKSLGTTEANVLANRMRKLRLAECLSGITVEETPVSAVVGHQRGTEGGFARVYSIVLQFFRPAQYPSEAELTFDELATTFRQGFCPMLFSEVEKATKKMARGKPGIGKVDAATLAAAAAAADDDEEARGGDGEQHGDEVAAAAALRGNEDEDEGGQRAKKGKKRSNKGGDDDDDDNDDDDEEVREGKLRFRGGRGEAATYDEGDEDDARIAEAARKQVASKSLGGEDDGEEGSSSSSDDDDDAPGSSGRGAKGAPASAAKGIAGKGGKSDAADGKSKKGEPASSKKKKSGVADTPSRAVSTGVVDDKNHRCSVALTLPLDCPKLLMLEIVEKVAAHTMVRYTPNIEKVYVVDAQRGGDGVCKVQTDGINFVGAWQHSDLVNVNGIVTNDVSAVLHTYGVEAARATIMREAQSVFGAYGIGVDPRHLCLIADFMTHQGGYRACNRIGIESAVSPFLKMSFETAAHFLTDATLKGSVDDLKSPSARLCVGRVVELGTGAVELLQNL